MSYGWEDFLSPFTWRYGSAEMRALWSEAAKRRTWRRIWVALADAQRRAGLVSAEQVQDLRAHVGDVDVDAAHRIEEEVKHDLMAEVHVYAAQCPVGGGIIHLGATSMDIEDNADALRIRIGLDLVLARVDALVGALADQVERWADEPTMAFTHLQPAEPTTVGYRLAQHLQDLLEDRLSLRLVRSGVRGKGFKGATGTSASYMQLLAGTGVSPAELEAQVMGALGLDAFDVATQTYPRKQDLVVVTALAGLGQTLYKFAFDLRLLQSPVLGEWAEPFGAKQIGSSAMPFKRNPIVAENIDSLARHLAALPRVAWDNAAHSLLERTLDDSANRRSVLPEAFLISDEILRRGLHLVEGLRVDTGASRRLLEAYGVFAATERVLMETVRRGASRQELHEVIRERSMEAWAAGGGNALVAGLCGDARLLAWATAEEIRGWLDPVGYVGDAPERARALAQRARGGTC